MGLCACSQTKNVMFSLVLTHNWGQRGLWSSVSLSHKLTRLGSYNMPSQIQKATFDFAAIWRTKEAPVFLSNCSYSNLPWKTKYTTHQIILTIWASDGTELGSLPPRSSLYNLLLCRWFWYDYIITRSDIISVWVLSFNFIMGPFVLHSSILFWEKRLLLEVIILLEESSDEEWNISKGKKKGTDLSYSQHQLILICLLQKSSLRSILGDPFLIELFFSF